MSIDIVSDIFSNLPEERARLINLFRDEVLKAFSKSQEYGLIFTYMWAFDSKPDWDYMNQLESIFQSQGADVYYVELEADYDIRIDRNKTENRLLNKPTKRDLDKSEELFRKLEEKYRLNSFPGELVKEHYIRINNTNLPPEITAGMICEQFQL